MNIIKWFLCLLMLSVSSVALSVEPIAVFSSASRDDATFYVGTTVVTPSISSNGFQLPELVKLQFNNNSAVVSSDPASKRTTVIAYRLSQLKTGQTIYSEGNPSETAIKLYTDQLGDLYAEVIQQKGLVYKSKINFSSGVYKKHQNLLMITAITFNADTDTFSVQAMIDPSGSVNNVESGATINPLDTLPGSRSVPTIGGFNGVLYEVQIYNDVLTSDQLVSSTDRTGILQKLWDAYKNNTDDPTFFAIEDTNDGFFCGRSRWIAVKALNVRSMVKTSYEGKINLKISGADGVDLTNGWFWQNNSGNRGDFDNDNQTYTFKLADQGTAVFSLQYPKPVKYKSPFYIKPYVTEGTLTYKHFGWKATITDVTGQPLIGGTDSVGPDDLLSNSPIETQIGGKAFPVYISVIDKNCNSLIQKGANNDTNAATLAKFKNLKFNGNEILNPDDSTLTFTFAPSGQRITTQVTYKDVGKGTLSVDHEENGTAITGTSNEFVIRPDKLKISEVQRISPDVPTDMTFSPVPTKKFTAGEDFTVKVEGVLFGGNAVAASFGKEADPQEVVVSASQYPSSSSALLLGSIAPSSPSCAANISPCQLKVSYSDVGSIYLTAKMEKYYGVGVEITSSRKAVGRFIPAYFSVAQSVDGSLKNGAGSSCPYTYIGQSFSINENKKPQITITAKNSLGSATESYSGNFGITDNTIPIITDNSILNTTTPRGLTLVPTVDLSSSEVSSGSATYTLSGDFSYPHSMNSPVLPFEVALKPSLLAANLTDSDGVCYKVNGVGNCADFTFKKLEGARMRYGRIILKNASGTELLPLKVPVEAQYWKSPNNNSTDTNKGFVINEGDNCTKITAGNIRTNAGASGITLNNLADVTLSKGKGEISLQQSNAKRTPGQVKVALDLDAAGENLPYLKYLFGNNDKNLDNFGLPGFTLTSGNPIGVANFGTYRGRQPILFMRQIYGR